MIRYPRNIRVGDTIGTTATSSGVTGIFSDRLDHAIKNVQDLGYQVKESNDVRKQYKLVSASPMERVNHFMKLYLDENVMLIIPPWGGERLMDMLPLMDFEQLKESEAKWVMGFSDTSSLMFSLTTMCDIATVHGPNLLDFGGLPTDESVLNSLEILKTDQTSDTIQKNSSLYQKDWFPLNENPRMAYNLSEKTKWQTIGNKPVAMSGRLIGGCLDIICKLIGTPYAPVTDFIKRHKEFGFIWYFESCAMNATDIYRTLLQMKMNGWFEYCNGLLYGRLEGYEDVSDFTFMDVLEDFAEDLNIPIVYDFDTGHMPPQLTLINGAYAEVTVENGQGTLLQKLI